MPSARYTRIEITEEAYMGLEAEAVLQGKTLKKLASNLILQSISSKALRFVQESSPLPPEEDAEIKSNSVPQRGIGSGYQKTGLPSSRSKISGLKIPGRRRGRLPGGSIILLHPQSIRSR